MHDTGVKGIHVTSHPITVNFALLTFDKITPTTSIGLVDIFTDLVRKAWQNLGLYETDQCYPEKMDLKGKIVAIRPDCLKDEYKSALDQLFYAEGGFGCDPNAIGRKVYGRFVKDGERAWFMRDEIQGVVKLDLLPEWAKAKQAEWSGEAAKMQVTLEGSQ